MAQLTPEEARQLAIEEYGKRLAAEHGEDYAKLYAPILHTPGDIQLPAADLSLEREQHLARAYGYFAARFGEDYAQGYTDAWAATLKIGETAVPNELDQRSEPFRTYAPLEQDYPAQQNTGPAPEPATAASKARPQTLDPVTKQFLRDQQPEVADGLYPLQSNTQRPAAGMAQDHQEELHDATLRHEFPNVRLNEAMRAAGASGYVLQQQRDEPQEAGVSREAERMSDAAEAHESSYRSYAAERLPQADGSQEITDRKAERLADPARDKAMAEEASDYRQARANSSRERGNDGKDRGGAER